MATVTDPQLESLESYAVENLYDKDEGSALLHLIREFKRLRKVEEAFVGEGFEARLEDVFGANDSWIWDTKEGTTAAVLDRDVITDKIVNLARGIASA